MRILHIGGEPRPDVVDGVTAVVWALARAQAELGHPTGLLHYSEEFDRVSIVPTGSGPSWVRLPAPPSRWSPWLPATWLLSALDQFRPHIVHLHSAFSPSQVAIASILARAGIPYIVRPAGGFAPEVLRRGATKKRVFLRLFEQRRLHGAAAVVGVTPTEVDELRSVFPAYAGRIEWIPNPVPVPQGPAWSLPAEPPYRALWLGRFDVHHKGLDRLADVARLSPGIEFILHGSPAVRAGNELERLRDRAPTNLHLAEPVFDEEKRAALRSASVYVHLARWEAFGISIAEALSLGVPVAVARSVALAPLLEREGAAEVLDTDRVRAASSLRALMSDPDRRVALGIAGRRFALEHLEPSRVARRYVALYDDVR
jgi:glycosyltransferase involved in cell wall biosynthesis